MQKQQAEILFHRHYRRMYAAAYGLLYDEQESKDAVSDVFASLLESNVELLSDTAGQYLLSAVRHKCLNLLRDKTNRERIARLYVNSLPDEDDNAVEDEWRQLCDFAHKELSEQELVIFTMRFLDGKDYKDICAQTGISRIAVWKHLSHIQTLLKEHYNSKQQ